MAGPILRQQRDRPTYRESNVLGPRRKMGVHSKKAWKRWVSAGMDPAGSPVTVRYMQTSRRPMLREEQADLSLGK